MIINVRIRILMASTLLSAFISLTVSSKEKSRPLAPQATAAEAELSFRDIPFLNNAFINAKPSDTKDGLAVGELGIDGGNKKMIIKLAEEIADGQHGKFDSLLIANKGKLLFESYYLRGRINLPHPQASATKAYTGLALGRAMQLGYLRIADLDKPLITFLTDLDSTKFVAGVEKITLNQALTMRGGLRVSDDKWTELQKTPTTLQGQGQVQALFEHSAPVTEESQNFSYGNFNPTLVLQVLEAVVPGTAKDFIKNELLHKMGITNYGWRTEVSGLPTAGWGANMTSRAMLKFGTMAKNKGKWKGEQLIPEAFMSKSMDRLLYTGDDDVHFGGKDVSNQGYGYYWWSADMHYNDKSYFSASAQGGGGQLIVIIEELDLLVVITGHDNDASYLQTIAQRILPAFVK